MSEPGFVFAPPPQPSLEVADSDDLFPIRRVYCVGRNYAEHAREMHGDPDREPPFFFQKPADAVVPSGVPVPYPPATSNLHHEIELVVAIGSPGRNIAPDEALDHVWGASVGVDLTRRDLQDEAKATRRPWAMAKGFDHSAPIAPLVRKNEAPSLTNARIWLAVGDTVRQDADIADQIWPVRDVVAFLSRMVALAPGDLIMTGTPAGVGALEPGDVVTGGIDGLGTLEVKIGEPLA